MIKMREVMKILKSRGTLWGPSHPSLPKVSVFVIAPHPTLAPPSWTSTAAVVPLPLCPDSQKSYHLGRFRRPYWWIAHRQVLKAGRNNMCEVAADIFGQWLLMFLSKVPVCPAIAQMPSPHALPLFSYLQKLVHYCLTLSYSVKNIILAEIVYRPLVVNLHAGFVDALNAHGLPVFRSQRRAVGITDKNNSNAYLWTRPDGKENIILVPFTISNICLQYLIFFLWSGKNLNVRYARNVFS